MEGMRSFSSVRREETKKRGRRAKRWDWEAAHFSGLREVHHAGYS